MIIFLLNTFVVYYLDACAPARPPPPALLWQPHVAAEGSPVISKFLDKLDGEVVCVGFRLWTLGQEQELEEKQQQE